MVTSNSTIHLTKIKATTDRYILVCHCKVSDSKRANEWVGLPIRVSFQLPVGLLYILSALTSLQNDEPFEIYENFIVSFIALVDCIACLADYQCVFSWKCTFELHFMFPLLSCSFFLYRTSFSCYYNEIINNL